jgi:membrane-associated phospholipid phosphatase
MSYDENTAGGLPKGRERRPLVLTRHVWSLAAWPPLLAVAGALVFVYWAADQLLIEGPPPEGDASMLQWVVGWRTEAMIDVARVLTFLGDLPVVLAVWAVLVTLARRRSGRWDLAWLVTVIIGGALLITGIIKDITDRARPDGALVEAVSFAFPSGHAGRAAAVWGLVAWLAVRWGHNHLIRFGVGALAVLMAVATGWARLVLGIHWPSDVLFGWVLGVVWLTVCILVTQPRHGIPRAETVLDDITDKLSHSLLHHDDEPQRTAPSPEDPQASGSPGPGRPGGADEP